jgi:hypothetical protein
MTQPHFWDLDPSSLVITPSRLEATKITISRAATTRESSAPLTHASEKEAIYGC